MQKARQWLMQIGMVILCVNGALWFASSLRRDEPATVGQLLFRLGVFLLGLALVGTAGLPALIEKFQASAKPESGPERQAIDKSDLIDGEPVAEERETE